MGRRETPFVSGEFYHIYNRGNSRQRIFFDDEDYNRFIKLLFVCNSKTQVNFRDDIVEKKIDVWDFLREETLVSIGAWVLMPNHFHLYMTFPEDRLRGLEEKGIDSKDNNITVFMRKLCTAYSKYINTKYKRTGSLFEGRFKSVHITDDVQARYLFSYIHLNPLNLFEKNWKEEGIKNKTKALTFLDKYRWSSYQDYLRDDRLERTILNRENFPQYFPAKEVFQKEILEWISSPKTVLGE